MKKINILSGVILTVFLLILTPCINAIDVQVLKEEIEMKKDSIGEDFSPLYLILAAIGSIIIAGIAYILIYMLDGLLNAIIVMGIAGSLLFFVAYIIYSIIDDILDFLDLKEDLGIPVDKIELARNNIGSGIPINIEFNFQISYRELRYLILKEKYGIEKN